MACLYRELPSRGLPALVHDGFCAHRLAQAGTGTGHAGGQTWSVRHLPHIVEPLGQGGH